MATVADHGSYGKLDGAPVSQAYRSVLAISFDVRGGLLIRQVHHWSADLLVAAIILRLLWAFFRRPGTAGLADLGGAAATGDANGLHRHHLARRRALRRQPQRDHQRAAIVPVIGTHLVFWIFGGLPGHQIIGRDYWVHILALPALAARCS